jgi:hypothetical protein
LDTLLVVMNLLPSSPAWDAGEDGNKFITTSQGAPCKKK